MTGPLPAPGLTGLFIGTVPPGLYRLPPTETASRVISLAAEADWRVATLPLGGVADKAGFLDRCAAALDFPQWFGHNWDALADCLMDLSWWRDESKARGYLLLAEDWDAFRKAAPKDARTAETILADAVDYWADGESPLAALLG
ncbi:barstar family protein [Streptomyces olivoreticuli]|uniref:barstar family protein n=1 Tax=Streptomyces olivoreticuli TaxID=68246 RepID=UPI00265989C4|nr:barstar family protein [Streptomyces olivoreticuli]WKK22611.1 barstar family protein [Streptomyces olivoreticuli]